jgi:hypothetical protein
MTDVLVSSTNGPVRLNVALGISGRENESEANDVASSVMVVRNGTSTLYFQLPAASL